MNYNFRSDIFYYVNIYNIQIINKSNNKVFTFNYPEAAILDLIIKNYPRKTIIQMIAKIGSYSKEQAKKTYTDTIELLVHDNIMFKE